MLCIIYHISYIRCCVYKHMYMYLYITRILGPGDFGQLPVYPLGTGGSWASSAVVLGGPWHPLPSFCRVAGDFVAHVVSFDVFWWLRVPSGPSKIPRLSKFMRSLIGATNELI